MHRFLILFLALLVPLLAQPMRVVNGPTFTPATIGGWALDADPRAVPYDYTTGGQLVYVTNGATAAAQATANATLTTIAANSLKLPTTTTETHVSVTTAATGTNYTAFASQACLLLDIVNTSGTDIEVTRGGTGVAIRMPNNSARMFGAITNASQLSVRRADTSNTQVAVTAVAVTP